MVKALLSVKPEYAEKILSGEKIYEFRRRIFKRKDVDILVIYATRPQCRVVAEARIGGIMESTPEDIWKRTNRYGGISAMIGSWITLPAGRRPMPSNCDPCAVLAGPEPCRSMRPR